MSTAEQQLLADMNELFPEFRCNLQDLRNPTEEFVINFYSCWLSEFDVDLNSVTQVQFPQTGIVGLYSETYSGVIPKINLLKCIREFNVLPDFGMLDITNPTPKRVQTVLRAFIRFYQWADTRVTCLAQEKEEMGVDKRVARIAALIKEKEIRKTKRIEIIQSIAQITESNKQLEEKFAELQQIYNKDLKSERETLIEIIEDTNKRLKQTENTLQKLNLEDTMVTTKIKDYTNQIVDSPTSILTDLSGLRQKSEETKELSEQKRDTVEAKMQDLSRSQQAIEEQEQRVLLLQEVLQLIDSLSEAAQKSSSTDKTINALQEQLSELKTLLISRRNKKQDMQERLQSLDLRWRTVKPQLKEGVEAAIREWNMKKSEKSKMINSLKEDAAIQEKIDDLLKQIKTHIDNFLEDRKHLQLKEKNHLAHIETAIISAHMDKIKSENEKKSVRRG